MSRPTYITARQAADLIPDGACVAIVGSGGGIMECHAVLAAIEERFLETGSPRGLTLVHALGIGDAKTRGLTHLAHEGLVARVIGGHWSWSPAMQQLAAENRIEAYALPAGVIGQLLRESGAHRPGLITKVGLGTFVDPIVAGAKVNEAAVEDLVERIEIDGETYLRYRPLHVDVGIVRGTEADLRGNISCSGEPAMLDADAVALAARGSGGMVIAQVGRHLRDDALAPWSVHIPHTLVDHVVVAPDQWQTYAAPHDPDFCSASATDPEVEIPPTLNGVVDPRTIIAKRAALEAHPGSLINVGFGMSSMVVDVLASEGALDGYTLVIEQGATGGQPVSGDLFGVSRFPHALQSSTRQFDFFASKAIDTCFLGMAEADRFGNVNVSKIGPSTVGPGGFIDIVHGSRHAVFCGTLTAKGLKIAVASGRLTIVNEGSVPKFVEKVAHITYSANQATADGRTALFVTERAVFRLGHEGLELVEVAPGMDVERDVVAHMGFRPLIRDVSIMPEECFTPITTENTTDTRGDYA